MLTPAWTLVSPQDDLDPARYQGEFPNLPPGGKPGDWCRIVVRDELGDMRWTMIAADPARTSSMFAERPPLRNVLARSAAGPSREHVAERRD